MKVILMFSLKRFYSICRENSEMTKIWPFLAKIWSFFTKIDSFSTKTLLTFDSLRGTNHTLVLLVWKLFLCSSLKKLYSICRENSKMTKIWPFLTKIFIFLLKKLLTLSGEPIILWSCYL